MKRLGMVILAIALALPLSAWAQTTQSVIMKSEVGDTVYGPIYPETTVPGPGDADDWGGEVKSATEATANPDAASIEDATWISTALSPEDPSKDSYRWFRDTVSVPCTASTTVDATLYVNSDGEVEVFDGETSLGKDADVTGVAQYPISLAPEDTRTFDFVLKTPAVAEATGTETTGLIYALLADYNLPTVLWRPPLTTSVDPYLKSGRTIPIKFKLVRDEAVMLEQQNVYVAVSDSAGKVLVEFRPGVGARSLRFSSESGQYIANFKTKKFALVKGETYTVSIHDGCSDDMLGSKSFIVKGKKKR